MIASDLGPKMASALIDQVRAEINRGQEVGQGAFTEMLKGKVLGILNGSGAELKISAKRRADGPVVVMLVGVNGAGKTTSAAKLAAQFKSQGAKVLLVAADTFRAAAVEQLKSWGERIGVPVVSGLENAKPGTVVFEAMERAKNSDIDIVLIDTAGRLHTKSNLMDELEGVRNTVARHQPSAPHEVILVVDGTSGQNAVNQAREFNAATTLTGIIVTKLDGTPKGGVVVAIKDEFGIPVRYIGVGEASADLRPFVAKEFVEALFDSSVADQVSTANAEIRRRKRRDATEGLA